MSFSKYLLTLVLFLQLSYLQLEHLLIRLYGLGDLAYSRLNGSHVFPENIVFLEVLAFDLEHYSVCFLVLSLTIKPPRLGIQESSRWDLPYFQRKRLRHQGNTLLQFFGRTVQVYKRVAVVVQDFRSVQFSPVRSRQQIFKEFERAWRIVTLP